MIFLAALGEDIARADVKSADTFRRCFALRDVVVEHQSLILDSNEIRKMPFSVSFAFRFCPPVCLRNAAVNTVQPAIVDKISHLNANLLPGFSLSPVVRT